MQPTIHWHDELDSTNELALRRIADGSAQHGELHVARAQRAGRGRLGRSWHGARDQNLYLSLVWLPPPPAPKPTALAMAAGLALVDLLQPLALPKLALKWPNDLCCAGAKLSGILIEARDWTPERPACAVGIGLNLQQREFPPELLAERAVTSLALLGHALEPREAALALAPLLIARLEQASADPSAIARSYLHATGLAGERVEARSATQTLVGRLRELDLESGLALELADGRVASVALEHVLGLGLASSTADGLRRAEA